MANLLLLGICFAIGIIAGRTRRFPPDAAHALNAFVINISLPALILVQIHGLELDRSLIAPALMPWGLFIIGAGIFNVIGKRFRMSRRTIGCLMLAAGLGNTSFVGLPMIEAFYGRGAVGIGVLADQPGSFLVLSTLGIYVAARYSSGSLTARDLLLRVLRFPPFIALLLALLLRPFTFPDAVAQMLTRLGDTLTPLALVSVGLQLRLSELAGRERSLALGLGYKMILAPALILFVLAATLGYGRTLQVTIFEAAMPPMITGALVAIEHDLDPPLATLLLGIGIPFGFLVLPLWWEFLKIFGPP